MRARWVSRQVSQRSEWAGNLNRLASVDTATLHQIVPSHIPIHTCTHILNGKSSLFKNLSFVNASTVTVAI
jgi:hypothetical protein